MDEKQDELKTLESTPNTDKKEGGSGGSGSGGASSVEAQIQALSGKYSGGDKDKDHALDCALTWLFKNKHVDEKNTLEEYAKVLSKTENNEVLARCSKGYESENDFLEDFVGLCPGVHKSHFIPDVEETPDDSKKGGEEDADGQTPEEVSNTPNIDAMSNQYIANAIRRCFRKDLKEGDRLAKYVDAVINKYDNWKEYIEKNCNGGKNTAVLETKVIPKMVENFNKKFPDNPIDKSIISRRVVDDRVSGMEGGDAKMVVPEGFNKSPIKFGNNAFSMDIGFFTINYASDLIHTLINTRDEAQRKTILSRILKKVKGTPIAKYLLKGWRKEKNLLSMLTSVAKDNGGTPMVRKSLKVASEELVGNSDNDQISVTPLDDFVEKTEIESAARWDEFLIGEPIMEAFWSKKKGTGNTTVSIPRDYLTQFYEVVTPNSSEGIRMYGKYLAKEDLDGIKETIGQNAVDEIKSANKNIREMILRAYLKATNGVPPFYILTTSKRMQERLRVSEDTYPGDTVCVKTVSGPNKAFAYMIPQDVADKIFEVG